MGLFILSFLSILPAFIICWFIYNRDHNKESLKLLSICFLFGMVSTIPAIILELIGGELTANITDNYFIATFIMAFIVVAFSEELVKFFFLRFYIYPKPQFNEPMDGIVYSVTISMGFAALENLLYVIVRGGGVAVAVARMFTAVPAHAVFAVIMGYFVGLAATKDSKNVGLMLLGLFGATAVHGAYDFFLFYKGGEFAQYLPIFTLVVLVTGIFVSFRLIKYHRSETFFSLDEKIASWDKDDELDNGKKDDTISGAE